MITRRTFLTITGGTLLAPSSLWSATEVPMTLDHILLGCSDLDEGIAFVEQHTGVRAAYGGVHPGRGTRNALLSLGKLHYLEIIAPDPAQAGLTADPSSMLYKLRHMDQPLIVTWAAHTADINGLAQRLRKGGIAFEGPTPGSRKRPDGRVLNWQTLNLNDNRGGLLPFFIQWGSGSVHPSIDAPPGCTLSSFAAGAPNSSELAKLFGQLGIDVQVGKESKPRLHAVIAGPGGRLELQS